jgi:hypothetical protein
MVELDLSGNCWCDYSEAYEEHEQHDIYYEYAVIAYRKYGFWKADFPSFTPIATELPLTSNIYGYGGTIDIYGQLGDKKVLIDIKTSNAVYKSHLLQVAGYAHLLEENDYEVDEVYILQISRDPDKPYHFERVGGIVHLQSIFQDLLNGYNNHKAYNSYNKTKACKEDQALHDAWLENLRRE